MLVRPIAGDQRTAEALSESEFVDLADIVTFLRRYAPSIGAFVIAGTSAAFFLASTSDPIYSAGAQILIEPKLPQYMQQSEGVSTSLDTAQIESQIAVMSSEKIAQMVIDELSLMDDPDFFILRKITFSERLARMSGQLSSMLGYEGKGRPWPLSMLSAEASPDVAENELSDFERSRVAVGLFGKNIDIRRVGVSYVVAVTFRSRNAELAAQIANSTANSFVREQVETKAAAARAGGEWLEQRMDELRTKMNAATQIAQDFRSRHDYRVHGSSASIVNGQIVYESEDEAASDEPTLEELEVTADAYRKMYESFLLAYTNNVNQQSYPVPDARVITAATRPLAPSYPRKKLVLAFGFLAGLMSGVGVAFGRHLLDSTVRSPRQIRDRLGIKYLGALPARRGSSRGFGPLDEVAAAPHSPFSETLRRVKFEVGLAGGKRPVTSIGVTSAHPDEGKSTVASNLALLYAMSGRRALLIDADEDFPKQSVGDLLRRRSSSLPASVDLLATPAPAQGTIPSLSVGYDIVIVTLPSLASGPESLAPFRQLDGVLVVTEWGRTSLAAAGELVSVILSYDTPVLGMLLTKARYLSGNRYRRRRGRAPV